jgi:hypothetical protein
MSIDLYTKTILTIIAVSLVWLCARDIGSVPVVNAQAAQRVEIVGIKRDLHIPVWISVIERGKGWDPDKKKEFDLPWNPLPITQFSK